MDQIEGILNRGRKVATYQVALFKALAKIATLESPTARWHANGDVGRRIGCSVGQVATTTLRCTRHSAS